MNQIPVLIGGPFRIEAKTNQLKIIEEYIGLVNTQTKEVSIALMHAPSGWQEPGQCPEFDEYTIVLEGSLHVEYKDGVIDVSSGQAIIAPKGVWVKYSVLEGKSAVYVSICLPAFQECIAGRDHETI